MVIEAQIARQERYTPAIAPLWRALDWLVSWLPTHAASRKGRKNAAQVRVGLLVVAVLMLAFGGQTLWLILGGLVGAAALVVPLSEVKKRTLRARLRRRMTGVRQVRQPARLVVDERRVVLEEDGKNLRRVLIDRGTHSVTAGRLAGQCCLRIAPKSERKAETIWVCAPAPSGDGQGIAPSAEAFEPQVFDPQVFDPQIFDPERVDLPAHVAPADLQRLRDALDSA